MFTVTYVLYQLSLYSPRAKCLAFFYRSDIWLHVRVSCTYSFLCSFSSPSEALFPSFPSFSLQLERFLSIFTGQQRWKHLYYKKVCEESRAICSVTARWHWYHITRCKRCAPKQRSCHAVTPGNMSELVLVPCCKSCTNLQSSLSNNIRIQGSKSQEGMGDIDLCRFLRKISCVMEDFLLLVTMPKVIFFLGLNFHDEQFTFWIIATGVLINGQIHIQYLGVAALQPTEVGG